MSIDIFNYWSNLQTDVTKLNYQDSLKYQPNVFLDMIDLKGQATSDELLKFLDDIILSDSEIYIRGTNIPKPTGVIRTADWINYRNRQGEHLNLNDYKRYYQSPILLNPEIGLTRSFPVDQHIYIRTDKAKNVIISLNPKRFVSDPELQPYEPLIELLTNYILPNMQNTIIKRVDINVDLQANPDNMKLYQHGRLFGGTNRGHGITQYMDVSTGLKLVKYDKLDERQHNSTNDAYFHAEELEQANIWNTGKGITRLELRCSDPKRIKPLLKNANTKKRVISKDFGIKLVTMKNGKRSENSWKDILNRCYDNFPEMIRNLSFITDDIYNGTKFYQQNAKSGNPYAFKEKNPREQTEKIVF